MTQNDSEINMQQIALEVVLPFKFPPKKKKKPSLTLRPFVSLIF